MEIPRLRRTISTSRPKDWASPRSWPTAPGTTRRSTALAVLLAQLSERYHRARRENGKPVFYTTELAQVKGTLEQCELELQKLHMLAGGGRRDARPTRGRLSVSRASPRHSLRVNHSARRNQFTLTPRRRHGRSVPDDVDEHFLSPAPRRRLTCPTQIPMSSRPGRHSPSFRRAAPPGNSSG